MTTQHVEKPPDCCPGGPAGGVSPTTRDSLSGQKEIQGHPPSPRAPRNVVPLPQAGEGSQVAPPAVAWEQMLVEAARPARASGAVGLHHLHVRLDRAAQGGAGRAPQRSTLRAGAEPGDGHRSGLPRAPVLLAHVRRLDCRDVQRPGQRRVPGAGRSGHVCRCRRDGRIHSPRARHLRTIHPVDAPVAAPGQPGGPDHGGLGRRGDHAGAGRALVARTPLVQRLPRRPLARA